MNSPTLMGLVPGFPGEPGGGPGEEPVFLYNKELKKLAKTPSPDGVFPAPFESNFLLGEATYIINTEYM